MRYRSPFLAALSIASVAGCLPVAGVLPGAPGAQVPSDFQTVCQANVGNPETQIAAFRATGRYGEPVVSTFDTGARFVIFPVPGVQGAGASVVTGATGANGCSVTEAGIEYTLTPTGQIYTDRPMPAAAQ